MAIRNIVKGDEILFKRSKEVKEIKQNLDLLDDMRDTLYSSGNGVGLAAPRILGKRIVVIDVGDGLIELINPVIVEQEGE